MMAVFTTRDVHEAH
jgi:hypothetical protein